MATVKSSCENIHGRKYNTSHIKSQRNLNKSPPKFSLFCDLLYFWHAFLKLVCIITNIAFRPRFRIYFKNSTTNNIFISTMKNGESKFYCVFLGTYLLCHIISTYATSFNLCHIISKYGLYSPKFFRPLNFKLVSH